MELILAIKEIHALEKIELAGTYPVSWLKCPSENSGVRAMDAGEPPKKSIY